MSVSLLTKKSYCKETVAKNKLSNLVNYDFINLVEKEPDSFLTLII